MELCLWLPKDFNGKTQWFNLDLNCFQENSPGKLNSIVVKAHSIRGAGDGSLYICIFSSLKVRGWCFQTISRGREIVLMVYDNMLFLQSSRSFLKTHTITRQSLTNVLFLKTNVYGIYNKRLDLIAHIIISYIYMN